MPKPNEPEHESDPAPPPGPSTEEDELRKLCRALARDPRIHSVELQNALVQSNIFSRQGVSSFTESTRRVIRGFIFSITTPNFPPPIRDALERYLLFLLQNVFPFLVAKFKHLGEPKGQPWFEVPFRPLDHFTFLAGELESNTYIVARYKAGLLRAGQLRLFELALDQRLIATMDVLLAAREIDFKTRPRPYYYERSLTSRANLKELWDKLAWYPDWLQLTDSESRAKELWDRLAWYPDWFFKMVLWPKFRSERLENLLLKYIEDGEPANEAVVEGLRNAQKQYETARSCASRSTESAAQHYGCCEAKERFLQANRWNDLGDRMLDLTHEDWWWHEYFLKV